MITEEEEEEERGVLDIEVDNNYKEMMNLITSEDEKGEGKYNDLFLLSLIGDNSDQISDDLLFTDINGTG